MKSYRVRRTETDCDDVWEVLAEDATDAAIKVATSREEVYTDQFPVTFEVSDDSRVVTVEVDREMYPVYIAKEP